MYLCTPKSIGKLVSNDLGVWRSPVSAPALGAGGHKFESCYPDDQKKEVLSRAEFPFDASARSPFDKFSGCSAARLARQLRELEVPSSNLGIPTNFLSEPLSGQWLFYLLFFHRIIRRFYRQIGYFPSENLEKSRGGVNLSASIIGKTKCDGIQNQMRLFGGRVSPKRKATKISHTHTKKHRSNGF